MFKGSIVALVTPMQADGSIDKVAYQALIEWHINANTHALVISGSTGESVTLTADEQLELISIATKQVAGRIPVIAGAGTSATKTTLKLITNAQSAGADACLVITPYCNKPTQKGLLAHYQYIAENSSIPIILYNVPARTACDMQVETVYELAKLKNIIGIKEATGDIARSKAILDCVAKDFAIYSGDDETALDLMQIGALGVISVTANVAPEKMATMCELALSKQFAAAKAINTELAELQRTLFLESNPIPTKWALQQMGKIGAGIRLPLLPLDSKYHSEVKKAMHLAGVTQHETIS